MGKNITIVLLFILFTGNSFTLKAQLRISSQTNATALAQKLVGNGIVISNAAITGSALATGFFNNESGTNINIDSGIVLSNGRVKSTRTIPGMDGNGFTNELADNQLYPTSTYSGDPDLAALIGVAASDLHDATILEFDFVPQGDSIKFNYVFGSEEYPDFACQFNDAFAFFISGPGFIGKTNIALIPGTTFPVTIFNINDQGCGLFPQYFIDNQTNDNFNYGGHTTVLSAIARVQPCQTYHLKLVIADVGDAAYDSGVFLEAKSLTSNSFQLLNIAKTDPVTGLDYLVEGCAPGTLRIQRQFPVPFAQTVNLAYGGSALNSIDVQTLPSSVTIAANTTESVLNIIPIVDNLAEGTEKLKIYTLAPCSVGVQIPTDSVEIEIRDFDILNITPDTTNLCRNGSQQLVAQAGYTTYNWDIDPTLSTITGSSTIARPVAAGTMYYCTATIANCHARDSAYIRVKNLELSGKTDIVCKNDNSGQIRVGAGAEWPHPISFSINNAAYQADSVFKLLPIGNYIIRIKDGSGCVDSIAVNLAQSFPDLSGLLLNVDATCSGNADGKLQVTAGGGKAPYQYSVNSGTSFQASNIFNVKSGPYSVVIKDANGCLSTKADTVLLNNDLVVDAGLPPTICEGASTMLKAVSNGVGYTWSGSAITNGNSATPTVTPVTNSIYFVTATKGVCSARDSVSVNVNSAPVPDAGPDIAICTGAGTNLHGTGGVTYNWAPPTYLSSTAIADPAVVKPLVSTTYYLKVTDNKGCTSLRYDTVKVFVTPAVRIFAGGDTSIAINQPLQLHAVEQDTRNVISWKWTPAGSLSNAASATPVAILDHDQTYTVTGTTAADCEGSDVIFIKAYKGPEIYVPTAFTPNGDGLNDILYAKPIGMRAYHYFTIFDRWGQKVFSTTDFFRGWDGRTGSQLQSSGSYVWIAEAVDFNGKAVTRKGIVTIIR